MTDKYTIAVTREFIEDGNVVRELIDSPSDLDLPIFVGYDPVNYTALENTLLAHLAGIDVALPEAGGGGPQPGAAIKGEVDLTTAGTQNIGSLPEDAIVLRVHLIVQTPSDAVTTVEIGDSINGAYMPSSENDPEANAIYISETYVQNGAAARLIQATVATPGTVGSAIAIIEYG